MNDQPPNYDDASAAYNAAQQVQQEKEGGIIDRQYYRGIPAIPKAVETIGTIIAYILVEVNLLCLGATIGYYKFATMASFVTTLILWIFLLLKIPQRILRCDCVNWPFVELGYYAAILIFLFFGVLFMSINNCSVPGLQASAAFGWFAFFAYAFDAALAARRFIQARREARGAANQENVQKC